MLKIIFLADIVGKIGRKAVAEHLPKLKEKYQPDLIIANAENLAHGSGFTRKTLAEMIAAGVQVFTSGNHAWDKGDSDEVLNDPSLPIIRPANYAKNKSGFGYKEFKIGENSVLVVNLLGKVFIKDRVASPFKTLEKILKSAQSGQIVILDFHAEATSEKTALALYFDGQVSAILGTHTHVPTADDRILAKGTAYVTDAGMIGYADSVIGADKNQIFNLFLKTGKSSQKHDLPERGEVQFNAVYLEIDPKSGEAKKIKRLDQLVTI